MPMSFPMHTLDPSSAANSLTHMRRSSAPPPVAIITSEDDSGRSPATLSVSSNGGASRKNSTPDFGAGASSPGGGSSSGPFSLFGNFMNKKSKNSVLSLNNDYPVLSSEQSLYSYDYKGTDGQDGEDAYKIYEDVDGLGIHGHDDDLESIAEEAMAPSEFNVDTLKECLKCVSCHRFLFPPIVQCVTGHMACKGCAMVKAQCAKCGQKMVDVPAKFAEMITEQFKVQCTFVEKGCRETITFKNRRDHEEICPFKPVQCPEFDCPVSRPMNEIFKHFRVDHHHHFVNAHGSVFNGDIRCDDANMVMGVERKWAPTMMKLDGTGFPSNDTGEGAEPSDGKQHFFLEILRTKHGVWHLWVWHLGEPEESYRFRCEIAVRKKNRDEDTEIKYSGKVHSIRIPPQRIILSGCLLSFSDHTATHLRYIGNGHQGHPVIDYKVSVSRVIKKRSSSSERAMAAGLTKMLRRFSMDSSGGGLVGGIGKANKPSVMTSAEEAIEEDY